MRTDRLLPVIMLSSALIASSSAALSSAALAQSTSSANTTSASSDASAGYTLDTPIESLVANPASKAILDKDLPGLTTHPMYEQFKTMSLKEVQPMSQGAITETALSKTGVDLAKLPQK